MTLAMVSRTELQNAIDRTPEWAKPREWTYVVTRETLDGTETLRAGSFTCSRDHNMLSFKLAGAWRVGTWHDGGVRKDDDHLITAMRMWSRKNGAIIRVIATIV